MQVYLGSVYVNDFNKFGRTYQVIVQADAPFRATAENIAPAQGAERAAATMVPLGSVLTVKQSYGPDQGTALQRLPRGRHQRRPGARASAPARRGGDRSGSRRVLPNGIGYEWTDLTYQQKLAGNTAIFVFPLCVLLVFLVLAAQYESWSLPLAVILIVPMCLLSRHRRRVAHQGRQQHLHPDRVPRARSGWPARTRS